MLNIKENIALLQYTVFKIGGSSDYFCDVKNKEELIESLNWAYIKKIPFFILGAGSNVLFSDEGFRGLIIKMNLQDMAVLPKDQNENRIFAGAGVSMARAVNFAIEHGIGGGFEWGVGVPGSIGGSIFGNAGCYGFEMKDVVESVEVFNIDQFAKANIFQDLAQRDVASREIFQQKNTRVLKNVAPRKLISEDCGFSYRHSIFKEHPEWIILGATLKLNLADPVQSRAKVIEYTKKRTASQDIGSKSAGCIFKNHIPAEGGTVIGAGFLIDKAGLKGRSVGGAKVSDKHANFIVNDGTATARDIKELIGVIKDEVRKIHGVMLEEEVRII